MNKRDLLVLQKILRGLRCFSLVWCEARPLISEVGFYRSPQVKNGVIPFKTTKDHGADVVIQSLRHSTNYPDYLKFY